MDSGPGRNLFVSFDRIPLRFRPGKVDIGEGGAAVEGEIVDGGHAAVARDHGGLAARDENLGGGLYEAVPGGMVRRVRGVHGDRLEGGAIGEGPIIDEGHAGRDGDRGQ